MYLSGCKHPSIADDLASGRIGLLQTPGTRYDVGGAKTWAMDNGAFTNKYPGDDAYMAYLDKHADHKERCLFVAAPDVVGDADATLAKFPAMAGRIRAAGWPVALVGQDGMESKRVPWDQVDWLFVGGSTEWKLGAGAEQLVAEAKAHGKRVHVGRVNSHRRFRKFAAMGCDSADGTVLAFGADANAPRIRKWVDEK